MTTTAAQNGASAVPTRAPRRVVSRLILAAWAVVAVSPVVLAWWTQRPYWLDLSSHFLPLVAWGWAVLAALLAAFRLRRAALVTLVAALAIPVVCRIDAEAPRDAVDVPRGHARLTLVQYNAFGEYSRNDNEFMTWLRDQNADLIAIIDPPWGWRRDYPYLTREYPYFVEPEPGLEWPVIVLSRKPAAVEPLVEYSEKVVFSYVARRSLLVQVGEGDEVGWVLLTTMHPPSPRSRQTWGISLEVVRRDGPILRDWMARTGLPVIVAGDFNSSVQGRVHRTFARGSGLTGWAPWWNAGTWHARMPTWLSLPIDRVFTGGGAVVRSMRVGPAFRSDHRPVVSVVDVPLRRSRGTVAGPDKAQSTGPIEPVGGSAR